MPDPRQCHPGLGSGPESVKCNKSDHDAKLFHFRKISVSGSDLREYVSQNTIRVVTTFIYELASLSLKWSHSFLNSYCTTIRPQTHQRFL